MPAAPPVGLRIAIGQVRMHWSGEANTRALVDALSAAAAHGAHLCVFPELALSGFHRQIRALAVPHLVDGWLHAVRSACARHALAAVLGAPTFGHDGRIFNSALLIDTDGELAGTIAKIGITPAEATFFAAGGTRPVATLLGRRCSAVLCREVEDVEAIAAQLPPGSADLVFWPGAMRPAVDTPVPDPEAIVRNAQRLARALGAAVIQSNWPNSLNYPDESREAGHSLVVDAQGDVLLRLPMAQAGIGVFTFGDRHFDWLPQPA